MKCAILEYGFRNDVYALFITDEKSSWSFTPFKTDEPNNMSGWFSLWSCLYSLLKDFELDINESLGGPPAGKVLGKSSKYELIGLLDPEIAIWRAKITFETSPTRIIDLPIE